MMKEKKWVVTSRPDILHIDVHMGATAHDIISNIFLEIFFNKLDLGDGRALYPDLSNIAPKQKLSIM